MTLLRSTILAIVALLGTGVATAQPTPRGGEPVRFGPPMRPNTLFAYKYTERVRQIVEIDGRAVDSSERVLSYFFTERQRPHPQRPGLLLVEANIDSMRLEVVRTGDTLRFNTQVPTDWANTKSREVMGPSVLVNRLLAWLVDSYGSVMGSEEKGFKDVREQARDASVDPFTRARVLEVIEPAYVRTVMIPWRIGVPVGREVPLNLPYNTDLLASLDRTPFAAKGRAQLERSPDGRLHAKMTGNLQKPQVKTFTYTGFEDPITITSGEGSLTSDMTLWDDGVVDHGWMIARGTLQGKRGSAKVTSRILHEIYYETIGTSVFSVAGDAP